MPVPQQSFSPIKGCTYTAAVNKLWRLLAGFGTGLLWCGLPVQAQEEQELREAQALLAQLDAETRALEAELAILQRGTWDRQLRATLGPGYRLNPELSTRGGEGRFFGRAQVDAFFWRRPGQGNWEGGFLVDAEEVRYLDPLAGVTGEGQALAHAALKWRPLEGLELEGSLDAFLLDQVLDLSETEAVRVVAPLKVHGFSPAFELRKGLWSKWTLELNQTYSRQAYRLFSEDYDEPRSRAALVWQPSEGWRLRALAGLARRSYAERMETSAGGRTLAGTRLHFLQKELLLQIEGRHGDTLSFGGEARRMSNRDEASGFFDYNQTRLKAWLEWESEPWRVRVELAYVDTRYQLQTVGTGIAPDSRRAQTPSFAVECERSLGDHWSLAFELNFENNRSNLEQTPYRDGSIWLGLARHF